MAKRELSTYNKEKKLVYICINYKLVVRKTATLFSRAVSISALRILSSWTLRVFSSLRRFSVNGTGKTACTFFLTDYSSKDPSVVEHLRNLLHN
jgi:hypothetical protein